MKTFGDPRTISRRLPGRPWWWIPASQVFDSLQELSEFTLLSKNAPDILAVCVRIGKSRWELVNLDVHERNGEQLQSALGAPFDAIWIPLGFVETLARWRELRGEARPTMETESSLSDEALEIMNENGVFHYHYADGRWVIIP